MRKWNFHSEQTIQCLIELAALFMRFIHSIEPEISVYADVSEKLLMFVRLYRNYDGKPLTPPQTNRITVNKKHSDRKF